MPSLTSSARAPRCLVFTGTDDEDLRAQAERAGAHGYLLEQRPGTEVIAAIRAVADGRTAFDRPRVEARPRNPDERYRPALGSLTPQEQRLLVLLGAGMSNREIATHMALSEKTVKNYLSRLLTKLGVQRRVQAAVIAARLTS